jgi:hypothetical protein
MKSGYTLLFVFLLTYLIGTYNKDDKSKSEDVGNTACAKAVEQEREALFPKDNWVETEAWILSISRMAGIKFVEMENRVANYEVGRAMAVRLALSQANGFAVCIDPPPSEKPSRRVKSDEDRETSTDD